MTEPEKLLVQGLGAEPMVGSRSNRIKLGPERLTVRPAGSVRVLKHCVFLLNVDLNFCSE